MMVRGGDPARRYPPLLMIVVSLALAVFALPSALNLPQANPGQTLEYAPVPGSASGPQAGGTIAGLGLGSAGLGTTPGGGSVASGASLLAPLSTAVAASTKACVGQPPRQTEDPLSPPCVAAFRGDNGGSTYPGVTATEVRVVVYLNGGGSNCSVDGCESTPSNAHVDVDDPPSPSNDLQWVRNLRVWEAYFNQRYQMYGRRLHFIAHYNDGTGSVSSQRADAADDYLTYHPFAIINFTGGLPTYTTDLAGRGVTSFGGTGLVPESYYQQYAPLLWGYDPSIANLSAMVATYICTRLQPFDVSFSGNPADQGHARQYGILAEDNPAIPGYRTYAQSVQQRLGACGLQPTIYYETGDASSDALLVAKMRSAGVTTIIQTGSAEDPIQSQEASKIGYFPEWVVAGDNQVERNYTAQMEDPTVWSHAIAVTWALPGGPDGVDAVCAAEYRGADPGTSKGDVQNGCDMYPALRQLATGIQVSGPRLTPQSVDEGFRAIPAHRSSSPSMPACYYDSGDNTCVKDAIAEWWDPSGAPDAATKGCWRMVDGGQRHRAGEWPAGPVVRDPSSAPCNAYGDLE